jgi:hypothetical protein
MDRAARDLAGAKGGSSQRARSSTPVLLSLSLYAAAPDHRDFITTTLLSTV